MTQAESIVRSRRATPALTFMAALLRSGLRNWRALAVTLGLPLFMLSTIWIPTMTGDEESEALMTLLFPAITMLSAIMPGLMQATRLARWREGCVFQRFALTPVALPRLMVGAAATQITIGVLQGMLMTVFGVLVVGLRLAWLDVAMVVGGMVLACTAFVAFGSLVAALCSRAEIAGYVFFFTILPLTFLASFPPEMMPASLTSVTPWLPTSMALELIGPAFLGLQPDAGAVGAALGLILYGLVFTGLAARRMRW